MSVLSTRTYGVSSMYQVAIPVPELTMTNKTKMLLRDLDTHPSNHHMD